MRRRRHHNNEGRAQVRAGKTPCPVCADPLYRCPRCGRCFQCQHTATADYWWTGCPDGYGPFRVTLDGRILTRLRA